MTLPNKKSVSNSAGMVNIKPGVPVKCYYPSIERDTTLTIDYYKTFSFNDCTYAVDEYAVIKDLAGIAIAKLLCIFTTLNKNVHIIVRKYVLAKHLKKQLKAVGCSEFDDNEVIEDYTTDHTLNASCILRKCSIIYAQEEESCVVSKNNLNPLMYFFCRYTLTSNGLFPILTLPKSVLTEQNIISRINHPIKHKEKSYLRDTTEITLFSDSSDENTPEKMTSPKNTRRNVRMSPQVNVQPPLQRNTVKRNLNKSFGESPGKNRNSILNYSIITDEEDNDSLILKLKVSEKNKIPLVLLKKCNDETYSTSLKLKDTSPRPVRKSTRVKERKSYADYISPRKRGISENFSENENLPSSVEGTPVKSSKKKALSQINSLNTPVKSSTKSIDVISEKRPVIRSARRSLRLTSAEEVEHSPLRGTTTTKRKNSVSPDKNDDVLSTEEKKDSLNESMRRMILKVRLKKTEVDEDKIKAVNSNRISRPIKCYESASACKTKSPSFRNLALRSRSKSMSSSQSGQAPSTPTRWALEDSDSDSNDDDNDDDDDDDNYSPSKDLVLKTPKTRNHENSPYIKKSTSKSRPLSKNNEMKPEPRTPKTRHLNYSDDECSPSKKPALKTPRSRHRINSPVSTENVPTTPRGKSNTSKPKSAVKQTPKTPRNRAKLIREGVITPSMHSRSNAIAGDSTPLMKARSQLHVSYVPTSLPCREKEYCDLFNFLEGKLLDGCGGCMYVSGVPGTGKTATVTAVVGHLQRSEDVPKFSYVSVNGMKITEPRQSYVEILKQLTDKTMPWEQAQSMLEERFTKSKKQTPVVMVIDELDVLCTKRQDVVYNLLDWPSKAKNQLIVVTIANTMDLPERLLMSRVTSRLGLTRLTFQAYTHKQLQEIVTKRLTGTDSFNPDAIQFVARKVASVSGDARRALDICRRAAEIAEAEGKGQLVNMGHVNEALDAMITQPKVRAIKTCSRLEQLVLQSIVAEVERTGVEETTFADVYKMLVSCAAIDGFKMVSSTIALSAISRLSACRLLLTDQKCNDINQRIVLNVSVDDVYYALKKEAY